MRRYWKPEHEHHVDTLQSLSEISDFALTILEQMDGEIIMVTGPISTGGPGTREKNLEKFKQTISDLYTDGHSLFDQTVFDGKFSRFVEHITDGYPMPILEEFYLPVFKSGKIKKFYFIKGWESSFGASWEHDRAQELGIEIIYLD